MPLVRSNDISLTKTTTEVVEMANGTISNPIINRNFFKDQLSSKDRILSFGLINCNVKNNPVNQYRSVKKNDETIRHFFKRSKIVLA